MNSPAGGLTFLNNFVSDIISEPHICHLRTIAQCRLNPFLIGTGKSSQLFDDFGSLRLLSHLPHGKIRGIQALQYSTDPRELILRDKFRLHKGSPAINRGAPRCSAAAPAPENRPLFKIKFVFRKDLTTYVFRDKDVCPVYGGCFQLDLEHGQFQVVARIFPLVDDICGDKKKMIFQGNFSDVELHIGVAYQIIFLRTVKFAELDPCCLGHRMPVLECLLELCPVGLFRRFSRFGVIPPACLHVDRRHVGVDIKADADG